jgi:FkbM family methyltransferase
VSEKPKDLDRQLVIALAGVGVDRVLDVGANVGQYARRLRAAGWGGDILSFEPLPEAHADLRAAAADDPAWEVAPALAVGATAGGGRLERSRESDMSSLRPQTERLRQLSPSSAIAHTLDVDVRPLGALVTPRAAGERLFLKIDVQGSEDAVLDGVGPLWGRLVGIQLELALTRLYAGERGYLETCARLETLGFHLALVLPGYFDGKARRQLQFDGVFLREGA